MKNKFNNNSGIVYSTGSGRMCPKCGKQADSCICPKKVHAPKGDGTVRVGRETKGRKGKGVTVITGLPLTHVALKSLAQKLKQKCGSGGTVKNGVIEIQGDQRDLLVELLQKEGYTPKRSGG